MTRFIERDLLRDLLAVSGDPIGLEMAALLECSQSGELVAIEPATATTLLPTYETRLAAAEAGIGPRTAGLPGFVAALRDAQIAEMFAVSEGGVSGIGLLSPDGDLVAITLVRAGG